MSKHLTKIAGTLISAVLSSFGHFRRQAILEETREGKRKRIGPDEGKILLLTFYMRVEEPSLGWSRPCVSSLMMCINTWW